MAVENIRRDWREDVWDVVRRLENRYPVRCSTYDDHPFPSWDKRSIDVWANGRTWGPIEVNLGHNVVEFLMDLPGRPFIRHWIYLHTLWTSWGGRSSWPPFDHVGRMRHVHVTYW